jgi:hypothetical protein
MPSPARLQISGAIDMKICSVTITSETKAEIIKDAIRSVDSFVDGNVVVALKDPNPGFYPDNTIQLIEQISSHPVHISQDSVIGKTAGWRNKGFRAAQVLEYDWACILDTDERIHTNNVDIRKTLKGMPPEVQIVSILHDSGHYSKYRFFRLPVAGQFVGHTHEEFKPDPVIAMMNYVRFSELEKSDKGMHERRQSMKGGLTSQMEDDPKNPRWPYQKGLLYEEEGAFKPAIYFYGYANRLTINPEDKAWIY